MSSLSKISIETIDNKCLHLTIEQIHPDAPSLQWLTTQSDEKIKASLLFRFLNLLENIQRESGQLFKVYAHVFSIIAPSIEEEYGDIPELNAYTELTEYGSEILENISDQLIFSVKLLDYDFNDNWEKGLIKNFNPYNSNQFEIPYLKYAIQFKEEVLEHEYANQVDYSPLSISCVFK